MEIDQIARTAKLMSLPLAFGGRAVAGLGRRLAGADRAEVSATTTARNAEQLFGSSGTSGAGAPGARSRCRPSTSWSYGCCPAG